MYYKMKKEIEQYIKQNYPIQTGFNNPILRAKSKPVKEITNEIKEFWQILMYAMELYDGIGLAAPQIWENIRMIVVCQLDKKGQSIISTNILLNPEIIEKSDKIILQEEACLSLPGMEWKVPRHFKVKVKYLWLDWKKHEINAKWLNATILQHEIDHLDWILFWDKVVDKTVKNINTILHTNKSLF